MYGDRKTMDRTYYGQPGCLFIIILIVIIYIIYKII